MGWLFGRKKKEQVPLPAARPLNENTLSFPSRAAAKEKIIEPHKIKQAAGVTKPADVPLKLAPAPKSAPPPQHPDRPRPPVQPVARPVPVSTEPLFVKVDVYQRILGEFENLRSELGHLNHINKELDASEYNEENHFQKLRRSVKSLHDKLLQVDKVLFTTSGD